MSFLSGFLFTLRDVYNILLASLGMFGGMEFLGEHEVTLLGPANKVFLDTVHSLVVHLPVS